MTVKIVNIHINYHTKHSLINENINLYIKNDTFLYNPL